MIRSLRPDDIEAITGIYNHYIENTYISFEEVPLTLSEMKARIEKVCSLQLPWLVAEQDGTIIGYAYASPWHTRAAYKFSAEITVYLSPQHQNQGWGSRLYERLFSLLSLSDTHTVIAGIALPNPGSIALHEKFGLKKAAHYKEVGFKYGKWIDVAFWQRIIG